MSLKPQLRADIDNVLLMFNGVSSDAKQMRISNYNGEPLHCNVVVEGSLLRVTISEKEGDATSAAAGATAAEVTIKYRNETQILNFSSVDYRPISNVYVQVWVSSSLKNAQLLISDELRDHDPNTEPLLRYILVQEVSPVEPRYRVEWITNKIYIENDAGRTDASVVPKAGVPSSTMGPMGLSLP